MNGSVSLIVKIISSVAICLLVGVFLTFIPFLSASGPGGYPTLNSAGQLVVFLLFLFLIFRMVSKR